MNVGTAERPTGRTLTIRDLTKVYRGGVCANDGLTLTLRPGEVFGLLGPNGAGKTTLVKQVIGLLRPHSGGIRLGRTDLVLFPQAARRACCYLPQANLPIDALRAGAAVEMIGRLRGGDARAVRKRTRHLFEALDIGEWERTLGVQLSGGVRRLVGFAMVAVWPGEVVILDEPTNDLDPLRRRRLWREIRLLAAAGSAVLLVTHNVLEAERSVDRLAVIDRGRLLAEGSPATLRRGDRQLLRLDLTLEPGVGDLDTVPAAARLGGRTGRRLLFHVAEEAAPEMLEWARSLRQRGLAEEWELGPVTLEDSYVELIGAEDGAAHGDAEARGVSAGGSEA